MFFSKHIKESKDLGLIASADDGKADFYLKKQIKTLLQKESILHNTKSRLERIIEKLLILQNISQFLSSCDDCLAGLNHVMEVLIIEMNFEKAFLVLKRDLKFEIIAIRGYSEAEKSSLNQITSETLENISSYIEKSPNILYTKETILSLFNSQVANSFSLVTSLASTLHDRGDTQGFIVAGYSEKNESIYSTALGLTEEDSVWFKPLVNQISNFISNISLINNLKEKTDQLSSLTQNLEKKVLERTNELSDKLATIEKMNKFMVDRELMMIKLKEEIKQLKSRLPV
jgi:hypothetical protein